MGRRLPRPSPLTGLKGIKRHAYMHDLTRYEITTPLVPEGEGAPKERARDGAAIRTKKVGPDWALLGTVVGRPNGAGRPMTKHNWIR